MKGCYKEGDDVVPVCSGIEVYMGKQMATSELRSKRLRRTSDGLGKTPWGRWSSHGPWKQIRSG